MRHFDMKSDWEVHSVWDHRGRWAAGFEIVDSHYLPAQTWRLFGKTPPDIIWITARKPDREARLGWPATK